MLRFTSVVAAALALPAVAQAQAPQGTIGGAALSGGGGCIAYSTPPFAGSGVCADPPAPDIETIAPVAAAPGAALPVQFSHPVTLSLMEGQGALTQVDARTWTFAPAPAATGSQLVQLKAVFPGPDVTGTLTFAAHVAVQGQTLRAAKLRRGVARAVVRVPAQGTVRAHVEVRGKRRSAVVERTFTRAGERRLRLDVRARGAARLVTRYTFPGAPAVEVSQRLAP